MIHGSEDEYTTMKTERMLFQAASEPKRLEEIAGGNHHFDRHQDELYASMKKGLAWISSQ